MESMESAKEHLSLCICFSNGKHEECRGVNWAGALLGSHGASARSVKQAKTQRAKHEEVSTIVYDYQRPSYALGCCCCCCYC